MKQKETRRLHKFLMMTDHLYKSAFMNEASAFSIPGEQNSDYLAVLRVFTLLSHICSTRLLPFRRQSRDSRCWDLVCGY